ncbi:TPA: 2-hydroxyglutaryl-CoA dehydratase [bacterium]|nr:2-hydroxyglutaryl-CoA dehydratase [bacterium]
MKDLVAGIDIGSVATKVVVFHQEKGEVLSQAVSSTGVNPKLTAQEVLNKALALGSLSKEDIRIVSTGYGRRCIDFGDKVVTEITSCAKGVTWIVKKGGLSPVRTIIDLGGQDTKIISLDEDGGIRDFVMNDKCAAGTGKFLEVIGSRLGIAVEDLAELAERSTQKITINSTCAVFAETEVISLIAQNKRIEDIVAGIHSSIVERIVNMIRVVGERDSIFFCGGGAKNSSIHKLLEKRLNRRIYLSESIDPQFVVALGAALN